MKKITRKAAKSAHHTHVDTYAQKAANTFADRQKLIASLPSSIGTPDVSQKKATAKKKESAVDRLSDTQES